MGSFIPKFRRDPLELLQRRLQVLRDLLRQHLRLRQVLRILQTLILEPEDVQVQLVPLDLRATHGPLPN